MNVYLHQIMKVKFATPTLNMRNTGCAALDLAYVGSGRLDGFFHNKINLWDIAAGILIVDEAGGKVSGFDYKNINNMDIIATNSNIFPRNPKNYLTFNCF